MANNDLMPPTNWSADPEELTTVTPSVVEKPVETPSTVAENKGLSADKAVTSKAEVSIPDQLAEKQLARQEMTKPVFGRSVIGKAVEEQNNSSASPSPPVIVVQDLTKTYVLGKKTRVEALRGISLEIHPGEFVAIMGPSGSGKSTFMNLLGCLDRPTSGDYWLAGRLVSSLSNDQLARVRNQLLGFVFQGFNLLGRATAVKNVALPMVYTGLSRREREHRAQKMLSLVGLSERMNHKPPELSGGQQQRVAIARALINGPSLLLADEPTGNLDSRTSIEILGVLQALNEQGLTIILVTHDANIAAYAKRQVVFLDGRIVRDEAVVEQRSAQKEWEALIKDTSSAEGKMGNEEGPK